MAERRITFDGRDSVESPGEIPAVIRTPESAPPPVKATGTRRFADEPLTVEKLYWVVPDERGSPCGIDRRHDVAALVEPYDPASIVEVVASPDVPLPTLVGALEVLAAAMAPASPDAVLDRAILGAAALLEDDRALEWQESGWRHGLFQVDRLATDACLELVQLRRFRRVERRESPARADDWALLQRIVWRGAARPLIGVSRVLGQLELRASTWPDLPPETVFAWIEAAITDGARPARLRIAAFEQLERFHQYHSPGRFRDLARAVLDRGLACFIASLRDAGSDEWLRQQAASLLTTRAPAVLAQLIEERALAERPLPAFAELVPEDRLREVASHTRGSAVAQALAGDDLDKLLAAATLAPLVGDDAEALRNAELLAELVGRSDQLRPENGSWSPCLGDLAGSQLVTLARARLGDAALPAIERAIAKGLAAPVGWQLTTPPGLTYALGGFADRRGADAAKARWRAWFAERSRPAESRFALYLAAGLGPELGSAPILDESEDPDLRALIGALGAGYWPKPLLAACADTSTSPWTAKRVLPVTEPLDRVPLEWIEETLRLTRHPVPFGRAVDGLVGRLLPVGRDVAALAAGVQALRARVAPAELRALATGDVASRPDPPIRGRVGAARWLVALGDPRDETWLAEHVAHREAWYGVRHQPPPTTDLERLMRALAESYIVDRAESELAPLLRLCFGEEGSRRILAGAFVVLAEDHLAAGREDFARRSASYAAELCPTSLDAQRLLRRWP